MVLTDLGQAREGAPGIPLHSLAFSGAVSRKARESGACDHSCPQVDLACELHWSPGRARRLGTLSSQQALCTQPLLPGLWCALDPPHVGSRKLRF